MTTTDSSTPWLLSRVQHDGTCRLVPSRFPPASLYDRVASPADLPAVYAIEMRTNPRLRQELGELSMVPEHERVSGPGTTPIMAAFTHLNPAGSRFSDGSWGVYYAAFDLDTAAAEVSHHRAVFLNHTREPAIEIDLRNYRADVDADLVDIRGRMQEQKAIYSLDNYGPGQAMAKGVLAEDGWGVAYDSVRWPGGTCVALFKPRAIRPPVKQAEHVSLVWDGTRISGWYVKSELHAIGPQNRVIGE